MKTLKGWRTILYNGAFGNTVNGLIAILLATDFEVLGFSTKSAAWVILVLKVLDNIVNVWLRSVTTTPMGEKF